VLEATGGSPRRLSEDDIGRDGLLRHRLDGKTDKMILRRGLQLHRGDVVPFHELPPEEESRVERDIRFDAHVVALGDAYRETVGRGIYRHQGQRFFKEIRDQYEKIRAPEREYARDAPDMIEGRTRLAKIVRPETVTTDLYEWAAETVRVRKNRPPAPPGRAKDPNDQGVGQGLYESKKLEAALDALASRLTPDTPDIGREVEAKLDGERRAANIRSILDTLSPALQQAAEDIMAERPVADEADKKRRLRLRMVLREMLVRDEKLLRRM